MQIAGPEQFRFDEFIRQGLKALNDSREVATDKHARYFGAELNEGSLVPAGNARLGETYFKDWVEQSTSLQPAKQSPLKSNDAAAAKAN